MHIHSWQEVWNNFRYGMRTTRRIYLCACGEVGYNA